MVEVVDVKCSVCGLTSNDLTGWVSQQKTDGKWYYYCPECVKRYDVDNEPVFPICGTCNARKEQDLTKGELKFYNPKPDSSLLLSDDEKQKYIHHSKVNYGDITVDEFDVDIDGLLQAELDHLAKPEMEIYKRIYCKHWDKVNDKCLVSVDDCIRLNFDCYDDITLSDYIKGEGK